MGDLNALQTPQVDTFSTRDTKSTNLVVLLTSFIFFLYNPDDNYLLRYTVGFSAAHTVARCRQDSWASAAKKVGGELGRKLRQQDFVHS
jgi:hypothetical protein